MCSCISRFIYVKSILFILCFLVLFSPLIITVPEQKGTCCPTGAVVLSPWVGFVMTCQLFLWKLLFICATGFMVFLTGSFKSVLICSSAIQLSSKECCMGAGYTFSRSCMQQHCWLILPCSHLPKINPFDILQFSYLSKQTVL